MHKPIERNVYSIKRPSKAIEMVVEMPLDAVQNKYQNENRIMQTANLSVRREMESNKTNGRLK